MAGKQDAIRDAFQVQAQACDKLGSPFTGRVCRLLSQHLAPAHDIGRAVFGWQGDPAPGADSVPLRLCGALNNLVITGTDEALAGVYPPLTAEAPDKDLWCEIERVLIEHAGRILAFLGSAPQTNEVRRSAVLLSGWCWLAAHYDMPLIVSEVGASAGLNLFAEQYLLQTKNFERGRAGSPVAMPVAWHGEAPPDIAPVVASRRGCDLAPIDATVKTERDRLLSYIWPDQRDRVERAAAAIAIAAGMQAPVDRADAADWLEQRLAQTFDGAVHLVQHTIAWQYFPDEVKERGEALFRAAGARATSHAPLARLTLEADDDTPGAAVTLTVWPGGRPMAVGRADYHGRWVDWHNPAL